MAAKEIAALSDTHLRGARFVYVAALFAALGGLLFGYDTGVFSGASFAISLGPIFWLLIAEIYPLKIRGLAEGTAATFNWASNLIVALTFLTLVEKIGASSTFLLYAVASVASWLFAYYFVPETRGRTLEEIETFWRAKHPVRRTSRRFS